MNKEIAEIIAGLNEVLEGHPWYGRSVYAMIEEADESTVYRKPNTNSHSLADLLFHIVTWAEFTRDRIEKKQIDDMAAFDALDWRTIQPAVHSWQKGYSELKEAHASIIALMQDKDDSFLEEKVDYRKYNFRYLLKGLIQHNIYHIGQIAYLIKFLR